MQGSEKDELFYETLDLFQTGHLTNASHIKDLFQEIVNRDMFARLPGYYKRIAVYLIREGHIQGSKEGKAS